MSRARDKANSTVSNFASTGIDDNADATAITIDSSERIGLNKTPDSSVGTVGVEVSTAGQTLVTTDNSTPLFINRKSSDGDIIDIRQAGSSIGSIGTNGDRLYFTTANKGFYVDESGSEIVPSNGSGGNTNNIMNLGNSASAFKDLYLGGNLYIGGTGSANALDDYEYGVFDPDLTCSGTNYSSRTIGSRGGYYEKVGNAVFTYIYLDLSAFTLGSGSGIMKISGLPFSASTARAGSGGGGGVAFHGVNVGSTVYNVMPYASGSEVIFLTSRDQDSWTAVQIGDIHSGTIFGVWFQLNYYVD